MKITIVGAGRVGIHLAKYFADEQQDVYLIDNNPEHLAILESDFNLKTFLGDPDDFEVLRSANTENADIFVAVTANSAENLVACALAKSMGAKRTIARVDNFNYLNPENSEVVKNMGVDNVVFPDYLSAQAVIGSLTHSWCRSWAEFENGSIIFVAVDVNETSPIAGKHLKELFSESRVLHISALRREHKTIIPRGDDMILPGDILYFTAIPSAIEKVMQLIGIEPFEIKNVILMGGSMVSELTVKISGKRFCYVIIDKDRNRCRQLIAQCPDSEIICGDASDNDVLAEAGINRCDAFVALTDNTETNILSCLTAQDIGVTKNILEVEKEQLIPRAESFKLGAIINKPIITANAIFQMILDANIDSSKCFALTDAEVGRLLVGKDSFLINDTVKDLKLPPDLTFAGLIRNGKGEMVTGDTKFQQDDIVIVFCLPGSLKKVEKLFGR